MCTVAETDVYVMLSCVIHTGVGHHRFLKVILKNVVCILSRALPLANFKGGGAEEKDVDNPASGNE